MKQENTKTRAIRGDRDSGIDVHDDVLMMELGIHPPYVTPRDPSVWTKTSHEKQALRKVKYKSNLRFYAAPRKSIPVRDKLIIQLKPNKKFPKSTYSIECGMHEIGRILSNYYWENKKSGLREHLVIKYFYNGREYKPDERPFWH